MINRKFLGGFLAISFLAFNAGAQTPPETEKTEIKAAATEKVTPAKNEPAADAPAGEPSQTSGYTRPDAKKRTKRYFNSMFGFGALGSAVATAGIGTWQDSPEEWGTQWEGFGRRFAANMGRNIIKNSVMYGMDEALKLDSHFVRSEKRDVGSRIKNAVISPVTARKPNGKRVLGIPRIVGTYTSSIIAAETFYPARYDYKDGLRAGTISLGFNVVFNLVSEFILKK